MRYYLLILLVGFIVCSCGNTIYIVRHGEKAPQVGNNSDVSLSEQGQQRALALKEVLKDKKIGKVYSTNTIRTRSTAQPTADHFGLTITTYGPRPDSAFISLLKNSKKNTLVVGHSNTIDDIANLLAGQTVVPGDLRDSDFDNLFILKRKGDKFVFKGATYGVATE